MLSAKTQEEEEEEQKNFVEFCSFCVELVGGTSKKQNWKGLGIAFIVIAIICLFIAAAILLTNTQQIHIDNKLLSLTEQDIFNIKVPKSWNGTWISNSYFSYVDTNDSIWIYNCDILEKEMLFRGDFIQQESVKYGIVSPSTKYVLIPVKKEKISSYYTNYQYDIYEKSRMIASIALVNETKRTVSAIVYSHSDHLFAFIDNFDIYVYNITRKSSYRMTFDGNRATVHNGLVEWIYEYEIFNRKTLLFWSPTDRYLAFIKINLTDVPKNYYLKYDFTLEHDDLYSIPYPKYNDPIPALNVFIFNTRTKKTIRVPQSNDSAKSNKSDMYIYHIIWYCDTCFAVVYGNRVQNTSTIQLYEIAYDKISFKSRYIEETSRGYLLSRFLKPFFSSLGPYAYIIRFDPVINGKAGQKAFPRVVRIHFNRSYPQIDVKSPEDINADEILHVDNLDRVYFTGFEPLNSLERQLYRWTHTDAVSEIECLSCNESCGYINAQFSLGKGNYYILECLGPSIPYSVLYNRMERLVLIDDNEPFREWISNRLMPSIEYFTVPLDEKNSIVGNGMIILPPNYNPNKTIASYPVIMTINDRLYDQRVTKKYVLPLDDYIQVIEDNLTVVMFDAHGSIGQDENYLKSNSQDWLERQYQDYIKVAQHLKWNEKKFNETLNDTRFGLRARGSAAVVALKLLEGQDEYICAFLQSPVYDLAHYYTTFSEHIIGLNGGMKSSIQLDVQNKSIAFVHGTADEIVHFKHSATLAKVLTDKQVNFDFKVYPDAKHNFEQNPVIYNDFLHYQRHFFQGCLGGRINKERKIVSPEEYD
ncbi:unnamed protein product [Adineta ricciae]|uniref:Uncharacterized protein n=1 Tax=Adineta ricciae TaxID=249248 RepID=A0A815CH59_ADIRI|nr:unnamed protein product [Adineta ricciae]